MHWAYSIHSQLQPWTLANGHSNLWISTDTDLLLWAEQRAIGKTGSHCPNSQHSEPFLVGWRAGVLEYVHYHRVWFWATSRGIQWISVAAALMLRYQRKTNIVKDRQEKRQSCFNWVCCVRQTLLKTRYQKSYRSLSFITFAHCHVT